MRWLDSMQLTELEKPISDIVPHILKRPLLSVSPADSLLQVGTFLAIGPQIYVDGLVVLDGQKPVGRIGGEHIIQYILGHQRWLVSYNCVRDHEPCPISGGSKRTFERRA